MAEVKMPKLGESVTEGTIGRWLKQVGDVVGKYEPLAEVVTDKVNAEIPSDFVGVLTAILVGENETVQVGVPIAIITEADQIPQSTSTAAGADAAASSDGTHGLPMLQQTSIDGDAQVAQSLVARGASDERETRAGGRYSPAVLKLAEERAVDLARVPGTGLGGRVTRKDVLAWQPSAVDAGSTGTAETAAPVQQSAGLSSPSSAAVADPAAGERIPLTAIRKTIARRMVESKQQAPHAWMMVEVDVTSLVRLREKQKAAFKGKEGIDLTFLPFFIKATVEALKEFPMVNSEWADDHILLKKDVNISIAVATPDALAVPVIHQADRMSIYGLAAAIADLARRARAGKLTLADVQGGTFTVNNTGAFGSILSQPIINAPQAAILSVEAIVKRPMVQLDDSIAVRSMVNLCMSLDHRILDGWIAGQFMKAVKRILEGYGEQTPLY